MKVLALPLIGLVRGYQLLVSPLLPQSCRYFPSCSAYGLTALPRFGLVRGSYQTVHRIVCLLYTSDAADEAYDV